MGAARPLIGSGWLALAMMALAGLARRHASGSAASAQPRACTNGAALASASAAVASLPPPIEMVHPPLSLTARWKRPRLMGEATW